jgi:hypothetical protein
MDFGKRRDVAHLEEGVSYTVINSSASRYKFHEGIQRLIFMPMPMVSKKNPRVFADPSRKGGYDWSFELWEHANIAGKTYVCPSSYRQPCPVCDAAKARKAAGETEGLPFAKHRAFFSIIDLDDLASGVQILETASGYPAKPQFPQMLASIQSMFDADPDKQAAAPGAFFADADNPLVVKISCVPDTTKEGRKYAKISSIELVPMKPAEKQIMHDNLTKVIVFDNCIDIKSGAELEKIYTGDMDEDDDVGEVVSPAIIQPVHNIPMKQPVVSPVAPLVTAAPIVSVTNTPAVNKKDFWATDDDSKEDFPF